MNEPLACGNEEKLPTENPGSVNAGGGAAGPERTGALIRGSEDSFRSIVENAPIGIFRSTVDRLTEANPALARMFGYASPEEMLALDASPAAFFVRPGQRPGIIDAARESKAVTEQEVEYRRKDGSTFTACLRLRAVFDAAGEFQHFEGFIEDISQRKELEKELLLREQRLNLFFTNSTAGMCILDEDLCFVQINEVLARINGLPAAGHLGKSFREVLPKLAPDLEPLLRRVQETGERVLNVEVSGETPGTTGDIRHWVVSYFPLTGGWGATKSVGCVVVDITEQKRAQETLREREEMFRQLAENITKVFWMCDSTMSRIVYVSPAYERIWGRSCESLYQRPGSFIEAIHPEDQPRVRAALEPRRAEAGYREEYRVVRPDGTIRWIHDRGFVVRNQQGEFYRLAGLAEDITVRREMEQQLRQAQKMEAIGQLAGGVAHDFNNILSATLMHLGLLEDIPGLTTDIREALQEVEKEAMRAASLTRQLLLFSRRQAARIESLDLNELIDGELKMLGRLLGENVKVEFQRCPEPLRVQADAGMLEQVVMNLCINARDAMPKGGGVTISSAMTVVGLERAKPNPEARPGRFVCLSVADTGCGIEESIRARMFEPFFTTKGMGRGTGLGLATVYGIVKQHEGWIEVDSQVGIGSTFRVYLPAALAPTAASATPTRTEEIKGGTETILLVEDEIPVRRTAALYMRKLGYAVLEAGNGPEAVKAWEQHQDRIALLFSDMVMPETLTGLDLAERFRQHKPGLKVIISSGYSEELGELPPVAGPEIRYLPKPYRAAALAKLVRRCLDEP